MKHVLGFKCLLSCRFIQKLNYEEENGHICFSIILSQTSEGMGEHILGRFWQDSKKKMAPVFGLASRCTKIIPVLLLNPTAGNKASKLCPSSSFTLEKWKRKNSRGAN